jgi:ribose transport system permease protein
VKTRISRFLENKPWIWAFVGCVILWLFIGIVGNRLSMSSLLANITIASFLAIVSLGQMFAVSSGGGGIDLSIPYVITLSAFLTMGTIGGHSGRIWEGVLIAIAIGLVVGLANSLAILIFSIPPIVATMAVGFILNTGVLIYSSKYSNFNTSNLMAAVANNSVAGVPIIAIIVIVICLLIGFLLFRLPYGRSLMAVGQNDRIAYLAGIRVKRTIVLAYCISAVLASVGGMLIAAQVHGAFLGMGDSYLLESIGAVVIGGTIITGGKSTIVGTLIGSLFLILIVSLMSISHLPFGVQQIIEGIIILAVLSTASKGSKRASA